MTTETVTIDKAVYESLIAKIKIAEMSFRRIADAEDTQWSEIEVWELQDIAKSALREMRKP